MFEIAAALGGGEPSARLVARVDQGGGHGNLMGSQQQHKKFLDS